MRLCSETRQHRTAESVSALSIRPPGPWHLEAWMTRRGLLRWGIASGIAGGSWLRALAQRSNVSRGLPRACILLWMDGGASHLDTLDPKPAAPAEIRGPLGAVATSVPGIHVSAVLPRLAECMQHIAIVRGMQTREGSHRRARFHLHTGCLETPAGPPHPCLGAVTSHARRSTGAAFPRYVLLRDGQGTTYGTSSGFLGAGHQPLVVDHVDRGLDHATAAAGADEFRQQLGLLQAINRRFTTRYESPTAEAYTQSVADAVTLMRSETLKAFDLSRESPRWLDAYGRTTFGRSCLTARRLVERGVPFVEVNFSGWDLHGRIYQDPRGNIRKLGESLDLGMSALIQDLHQRGLLQETVIVWMGEFGRTPRMNRAAGRDHYPKAWSAALVGGGVRGGRVVGKTDATGAEVIDRPVQAEDLLATIYELLDIDPNDNISRPDGRNVPIIDNRLAAPTSIHEILS